MASITLKNIPESLHLAYKRRAKAHARSLQSEIIHTLAHGVTQQNEGEGLKVEEVAGMLKPRIKGVTIQKMNERIDQALRKSWK